MSQSFQLTLRLKKAKASVRMGEKSKELLDSYFLDRHFFHFNGFIPTLSFLSFCIETGTPC